MVIAFNAAINGPSILPNKVLACTAHREIFSKSYSINPKSDCIYHFPIDLDPNGCPNGSKLIGKW